MTKVLVLVLAFLQSTCTWALTPVLVLVLVLAGMQSTCNCTCLLVLDPSPGSVNQYQVSSVVSDVPTGARGQAW